MTFEYKDKLVNILDTPGHKDFAEDTYRTLTAVDSVILVIDCVKGVEEQTERLMEVCRMRNTPVIVFINKMDRDGKDPFDLLDELENKLNIHVHPMSWPINGGSEFKGVYLLHDQSLNLFESAKTKLTDEVVKLKGLDDAIIDTLVGEKNAAKLREDAELIDGVYGELDQKDYMEAHVAPVFFGSALNNFGIQELLDTFIQIAPTPMPRATATRSVDPDEQKFTGFIFKIHANLDPKHRDRIAFLRVCSGRFERNKPYEHTRLHKGLRFANPYTFLAQSKEVVDYAFPGDVVGLYDTGNFKIGDTLTEGEDLQFKGIPSFSPEIFRELINIDPMKSKQLEKGIQQLTDEGLASLFVQEPGSRKFVGTVGELQFEVLQYRLEHEYGAKCRFEARSIHKACWMSGEAEVIKEFMKFRGSNIAYDKDGLPVFLAETAFVLRMAQENNPKIHFHTTSEFKV
jgi:peptide chain release factor 3